MSKTTEAEAKVLRECADLVADLSGYGDIVDWLRDCADSLDPPQPEYMSREEALGFVIHEKVVVRHDGNSWCQIGRFTFDYQIKDYEWAYIDRDGNIGKPRKFTK